MPRLLMLALLLCLTSGVLVACGGDDPDTAPVATVPVGDPISVTGGRTTITLDPITAGVLTGAEVSVEGVAPATASGTSVSLPVVGGKITSGTLAGSIEHDGGIAFVAGKRRITYSDLRIDTVAQQVFAGAGDKTALFDLDLRGLRRSDEDGGTIVVKDIVALLAVDASKELNAGLQVSAFVPSQVMAKVTVRVQGS